MLAVMRRVDVIVPRRLAASAVRAVHRAGVLHLVPFEPPADVGTATFDGVVADAAGARFGAALDRITELAILLGQRGPDGTAPGVHELWDLPDAEVLGRVAALEPVRAEADRLLAARQRAFAEAARLSGYLRLIDGLRSVLAGLPVLRGYGTTGIVVRAAYRSVIPAIHAELERIADGRCEVVSADIGPDRVGAVLIYPVRAASEVRALLGGRDLEEVALPDELTGVAFEELGPRLRARLGELAVERERASTELTALAARHDRALGALRAVLADRVAETAALGTAAGSDHLAVISGEGEGAFGLAAAHDDSAESRSVLGGRPWTLEPACAVGDELGEGDVVATVAEGPIGHQILVPPGTLRGRLSWLAAGSVGVADRVATIVTPGGDVSIRLAQPWPVRVPRPVRRHLEAERPLLTGQRVIDMLFPVAEGGSAVIPGGFGTGKTVVEQALARWSTADVVVYVGCGERGNEMAELLDTFPTLVDPRTGRPLLERTVLVANTSNMPVAAREASVQLGITIAEYFRDQGLAVALLADSTSRWAEALREISGRLEELPGEEGFPAYLASRLAGFYERAGRVVPLGDQERVGSVTLVGAVSPPGGDFSEPVTQASLRLAGTFWALDAELAHARHFPAIGWTQSYSLPVEALAPWYEEWVDPRWAQSRAAAIELLGRERQLLEIVQLVGADALPDDDRVTLEVARLLREVFLQQHAFDPVDAARPPDVQFALLRAVLEARAGIRRAVASGATLDAALAAPDLAELRRAKGWSGDDVTLRLRDLADRLARLELPAPHPAEEPVS